MLYTLISFRKIVLSAVLMFGVSAQAQKLAEFNLNSFDGWTYTRSGVELNYDYICGNKVNIYGNYMLVSPQFTCKNVKYVKAEVRIIVKDYSQAKYSISKASPTLELLNEQGVVVASSKHAYSEALYEQNFVHYVAVPEGAQRLSWRLSAASADVNSTGAVHEVVLTASDTDGKVAGDVNGDGVCDVSDVTELINIILGEDIINDVADIDGNGTVDVSDVTTLINLILS